MMKATLLSAFLLASGATATSLSAQAPATRNYTITVRQSSGEGSYQVTIRDSANAPVINIARVTPTGLKALGAITGGEMADSAIAKLYTLDVWQLASKNSDDASCGAAPDGKTACETASDAADLEIVVTSAGEVRHRKFKTPSRFNTPEAKRAQQLIDYVLDLGSTFDG